MKLRINLSYNLTLAPFNWLIAKDFNQISKYFETSIYLTNTDLHAQIHPQKALASEKPNIWMPLLC